MINKTLFILCMLLVSFQSNAQKAKVTSTLNFSGTIGKYPVEMMLMLNNFNDNVSGEYYYVKSGRENKLILSGILKDGVLKVSENSYNPKTKKFEVSGFLNLNYQGQTSLKGNWNKDKNSKNATQSLPVNLNVRENLEAFNPIDYDFVISKKKPDYENVTENESGYFTILNLQINTNKTKKWLLTGFDDHNLVQDESDFENLNLEDVNFDGYLDIKVNIYYPDMAKNDYSYVYFIYDVKSNNFRQNKALNDLGVLTFDAVHKEMIAYDADGSGNEGTKTYKWHNGKILITKEERIYENDDYTHFTEYKVINGKSVIVKEYKTEIEKQ